MLFTIVVLNISPVSAFLSAGRAGKLWGEMYQFVIRQIRLIASRITAVFEVTRKFRSINSTTFFMLIQGVKTSAKMSTNVTFFLFHHSVRHANVTKHSVSGRSLKMAICNAAPVLPFSFMEKLFWYGVVFVSGIF